MERFAKIVGAALVIWALAMFLGSAYEFMNRNYYYAFLFLLNGGTAVILYLTIVVHVQNYQRARAMQEKLERWMNERGY